MIPLVSIFFSLALPVYAIWKANRAKPLRRPYLFSIGSFAFCTIAAIAELFTMKKRLLSGDIGGIEDTIDAVLEQCIGLLIFTLVLNLLALGLSYERAAGEHN